MTNVAAEKIAGTMTDGTIVAIADIIPAAFQRGIALRLESAAFGSATGRLGISHRR